MGTSTHNSGQIGSTPLVPSWLEENSGLLQGQIPQQGDPQRFTVPRGSFTRYAGSGGGNGRALRRLASDYVKNSLGGSKNATTRLGSARKSTSNVFGFFNALVRGGVSEAGYEYKLDNLLGRHADEVFREIAEFVCPDGGTTDEGIARSSYFEALIDMPELAHTNIEDMTIEQMSVFLQLLMANVVMERLLNDIGSKAISLPNDIQQVDYIQDQVKDFVHGDISDAFSKLDVKNQIGKINKQQTQKIVDAVYERAYSIIEAMGGGA